MLLYFHIISLIQYMKCGTLMTVGTADSSGYSKYFYGTTARERHSTILGLRTNVCASYFPSNLQTQSHRNPIIRPWNKINSKSLAWMMTKLSFFFSRYQKSPNLYSAHINWWCHSIFKPCISDKARESNGKFWLLFFCFVFMLWNAFVKLVELSVWVLWLQSPLKKTNILRVPKKKWKRNKQKITQRGGEKNNKKEKYLVDIATNH